MKALIDFEGRPELEFIVSQYLAQGMTVESGGSIESSLQAHSPSHYLEVYRPEFSTFAPLKLRFTIGQKRVKLWAGTVNSGNSVIIGTLLASDKFGNHITQDGPKTVNANACNTSFEVNTSSNNISSVMLVTVGVDNGGQPFDPDQVVDDIEFESDDLLVRSIPFEPNIYNPWWFIETHGGLTPPGGGGPFGPWAPWVQQFAVAVAFADTANKVSHELRANVLEIAMKQIAIATKSLQKEIENSNKNLNSR